MKRLVARDFSVYAPGAREPVVRGVHLEVDPGEWIAIAGPNGCGKTSLLLGLAGLWPSTGHLELDGRPLAGDPAQWRRAIGVVFQDPASQILHSTVFDEIAFAPRNLGLPEREVQARVERCSARLGLSSELEADPSRLSAGRQQLVALAAVLAAEPDLLLADEVTTHLDPVAVERLLTVLREELVRGAALVTVAGRAAEIERADRVMVLGDGGRVVGREGQVGFESLPPSEPLPTTARSDNDRARSPRARVVVAPLGENGSGPVVRTASRLEIELPANGVVALVGANAAGKSVILGAIAGILTCPQVEVLWTESQQTAAIMTLQYPEQQLFEDRVADETTFAAVARGCSRETALQTVRELVSSLGLDPGLVLGRRVWDLSGGERRLVQLAAALAAPASVYLLDEATAGLDPDRKARLTRVIDRMAQDTLVVIATQDLGWVVSLSARSVQVGEVALPNGVKGLKTH